MLSTQEILRRVRELEIKSKKLSANIFSGEYHSAFKGRGMAFKEVREYAAGDDIRFIDWNVSARFGHPFSKLFEEERELTVMLLIDISASNFLGSRQRTKQELITEIGAVLAFSAISNNDKVGAIFFTNQVELYIPPKKGRDHVLFIVRKMLTIEPRAAETDIGLALRFFNHTVHQRSIAFLLSDFEDAGFEKQLKASAIKHDCVGIKVYDEMELKMPAAGLVPVIDAETGSIVWLDAGDKRFKKYFAAMQHQKTDEQAQLLKQAGVDFLKFRTDEDFVRTLQNFFLQRMKRK